MNTINYYYTPQKRERVIFIGNRKGLKNYHPKPNEPTLVTTLPRQPRQQLRILTLKMPLSKESATEPPTVTSLH